jgi:hypothetical protein
VEDGEMHSRHVDFRPERATTHLPLEPSRTTNGHPRG